MMISERKEIAKAINSGNYPVLSVDLDNKPHGGDCVVGCKVNIAWDKPGYEGMNTECELVISDGRYRLKGKYKAMLPFQYGMNEFLDDVSRAKNPMVHKGQVVAVVHYSKNNGVFFVRMMQVSERIRVIGQVVAELVDVADDFKLQDVRQVYVGCRNALW